MCLYSKEYMSLNTLLFPMFYVTKIFALLMTFFHLIGSETHIVKLISEIDMSFVMLSCIIVVLFLLIKNKTFTKPTRLK